MRKLIISLLLAILFCCCACSSMQKENVMQEQSQNDTESVTVDPALLPDVYDDESAFFSVAQIEMTVPDGADEITRVILYDEVNQMQFTYNGIFYTYRAAYASTGRTGEALTDIVEVLNYLDEEVSYKNDKVNYKFEAHLIDGGNLLLWSDGDVNYSLASLGGTFDEFSVVADLIIK